MNRRDRPDRDILYSILVETTKKGTLTYADLSKEYQKRTGVWYEPTGTWDASLEELNAIMNLYRLPPISALVILKAGDDEQAEPGAGFWGCAGVPPRPKSQDERFVQWVEILKRVQGTDWPAELPGKENDAEVMSLSDVQTRYESEWILLEDPKTSATLEVQGGRVLWHSKDRDEVYRKARELGPTHSAVLFTGTLPNDEVVVL